MEGLHPVGRANVEKFNPFSEANRTDVRVGRRDTDDKGVFAQAREAAAQGVRAFFQRSLVKRFPLVLLDLVAPFGEGRAVLEHELSDKRGVAVALVAQLFAPV